MRRRACPNAGFQRGGEPPRASWLRVLLLTRFSMGFQRDGEPLAGVQRAKPAQSLRSLIFLGTYTESRVPYKSNENNYPSVKSFAFATSPFKGRQEGWLHCFLLQGEARGVVALLPFARGDKRGCTASFRKGRQEGGALLPFAREIWRETRKA